MMQQHSISFSTDPEVFVPGKHRPHDRVVSRLPAFPAFCPDLSVEATIENINRRSSHRKILEENKTAFRKSVATMRCSSSS